MKGDVVDSINFSLNWFIGEVSYDDYVEEDFSLENLKDTIKQVVEAGVDEIKDESDKYFKEAFEKQR